MSRSDFFSSAQDLMGSCRNFKELSVVVESLSKSMAAFHLPQMKSRRLGEVGEVDPCALKHLSDSTPHFDKHLIPVKIVGDGNCFPRSLSVFCFGNQDYHREIRCRIVAELVTNVHDFLNVPKDELNFLCQFSDCLSATALETFQEETLKVCKNSEYMGMWQLMAAAQVFKTPILSVYPSLGPEACRKFYNCTVFPTQSRLSQSLCVIFWSATELHEERLPKEYWTANHVVPLVGKK